VPSRRQIWGGGGNRLNTGLLVVGEDSDVTFCFGQRSQHFGGPIDVDDLGLAFSKRRVAAIQIVPHLVGLIGWLFRRSWTVLGESSARHDPPLGRGRVRGLPTDAMSTARAANRGPWLDARLADQPSPRRLREPRQASRTRQVVDRREQSELCGPSSAARDPWRLMPSAAAVSLALHRSAKRKMIADRST
jgi:hypothetical protein